jgi:hypothetical protein
MKRSAADCERIYANHISEKGPFVENNNSIRKWSKGMKK